MESMIALGAVVTVVGAISTILIRVMAGDGQRRRLAKIKAELLAEQARDKKK
jgi:hypothetical protein